MTWYLYLNSAFLAASAIGAMLKAGEVVIERKWLRWVVIVSAPVLVLPAAIWFVARARLAGGEK
jgi:hypothetical protein